MGYNLKKMALSTIVIIVSVAAFVVPGSFAQVIAIDSDSWTALQALPSYNYYLGAVAINGKIYVIGGASTQRNDGLCEQYDPDTNTWANLTAPPIYNSWASVIAFQNRVYVIGGANHFPTQVYDPSTDKWENKTAIPRTLSGHEANVIGDKIFIISGRIPAAIGVYSLSEITYVYNPANDSWSTMASIPTPVAGYASTVLDDKIYIIGGGPPTDYHSFNATASVQIFDPKVNKWSFGKPLPSGLVGAAACSTSGLFAPKRIYVVGGNPWYSPGGTSVDSLPFGGELNQAYDIWTGQWISAAPALAFGAGSSLVNINDQLFLIGGRDVQTVEKYTPDGYIANSSPTKFNSVSSTSISDSDTGNSLTVPIALVLLIVVIAVGLSIYRTRNKD